MACFCLGLSLAPCVTGKRPAQEVEQATAYPPHLWDAPWAAFAWEISGDGAEVKLLLWWTIASPPKPP